MDKYFTYILYSVVKDKYYVGQTSNVEKRLAEHIAKKNLGADDWIVKFVAKFGTRSEAVKFESFIKSKKRRSYIEYLIESSDNLLNY